MTRAMPDFPERVTGGPPLVSRKTIQQLRLNRQMLLLPLTVLPSWGLILLWQKEALWQTLLLFLAVSAGGLALISNLSWELKDPLLQKLGYVHLLKLPVLLALLYFGWVPMLDPESPSFGFDPQRYYFDAKALVDGGFGVDVAEQLNINYTGIVYYYGLIFALLGRNPVIPALVNAFVTLMASLVLVRTGYQIVRVRGRHDWWLGLVPIIPEVMWYDVMTARETISMSLGTIAVLLFGQYLVQSRSGKIPFLKLTIALSALVLLAFIRTPLVVPAVCSLVLIATLVAPSGTRRNLALTVVALALLVLVLAPSLAGSIGSYRFGYADLLEWISNRDEAVLSTGGWSERSLGQLLIPHNTAEAIVFAPVRLLFYVLAPFPRVSVDGSRLAAGAWDEWQNLMVTLSALLYTCLFPLAVASALQTVRRPYQNPSILFQVPLWMNLIAISAPTFLILERYRLVAVTFLWGCIWLGMRGRKSVISWTYLSWVAMLSVGVGFYVAYKYLQI